MNRNSLLLFLLITYQCKSYNNSIKTISVLEKFQSTRIIEIKIDAPYNHEIISVFNNLKKDNQQVTIYFDRHSLFGIHNKYKTVLDSNRPLEKEETTYYKIDEYNILQYDFILYPIYSLISRYSIGLLPINEKYIRTLKLSASRSEFNTKHHVASFETYTYIREGIYYSFFNNDDYKKDNTLNSYKYLARYILQ